MNAQKSIGIVYISCKWSAMGPIEIYCFIAPVCPQWASPRLWLVSSAQCWPLIGQCLVTVTVVMCPVSRMSRGHKHYCHECRDKSQNSDTRGIKFVANTHCQSLGEMIQVWFRASSVIAWNWNISSSFCHNTPIVWQMVTVCKMGSDIKHPDNRFYWSEGWWWCEACNEKLPTHVIIPSCANRPD